jgi:hypothetical protein
LCHLPLRLQGLPPKITTLSTEMRPNMKKTNVLLLAGLLAAANQAGATISATNSGPSDLFLVVYDSASKKTYYKDLGILATEFVAPTATSCVEGNIAGDPNFASFLSSATTVFQVAAFNPLVQANDWGYMLTSATDGTIFPTASNLVDQTLQNVQGYAVQLNGPNIGKPSENLSGVYDSTNDALANYNGGAWGPQINLSVKGSTEGSKTLNPGFFFLSGKSNTATKLGTFSLASGVLSFTSASGAGTTKICNYTPTPTPVPPTPVASTIKLTATPAQATVKAKTQITLTAAVLGDYAKENVTFTYQIGNLKKQTLRILSNYTYDVTKSSPPPSANYVIKFPASSTFVSPKGTTFEACTVTTKKCSSAKVLIKNK